MLSLRRIANRGIHELALHMKRDFPIRELTPLFLIKRAVATGLFEPWYLLVDGKKAGYAMCLLPESRPYVMIQYFAVLPQYRSKGLGSSFMKLLDLQYPERDIVLEIEDPEAAVRAQEYRTRKKRLSFYERNGFTIQQGYRFDQVGMRMLLLAKSPVPVDDLTGLWNECYQSLLGPVLSNLMRVYPYPFDTAHVRPGIYRHFKGGLYEVISVAKHSETLEPMVVYQAMRDDGGLWVRPASMWNQMVERDGKKIQRFTYVGK